MESINYPPGWYDPPQNLVYCGCKTCGHCGGKYDPRGWCDHGENDNACCHKVCEKCGDTIPHGFIKWTQRADQFIDENFCRHCWPTVFTVQALIWFIIKSLFRNIFIERNDGGKNT